MTDVNTKGMSVEGTNGEIGIDTKSSMNLVSEYYGQVPRDAISIANPLNVGEINKGDNPKILSSMVG